MVTHEFPYTNLHDLNIDWILKVVKDFQEKYTDFGQNVLDAVAQIEAKTAEGISALNAKELELVGLLEEYTNGAKGEIDDEKDASLRAIIAQQASAVTSITDARDSSLQTIQGATTQGESRLNTLINSFPLDDAEIIGQLQIINSILNGTDALTVQWQQGYYLYDPSTSQNYFSPSSYGISSVVQAGCAGRKLHVKANTPGHLITYIYYWTGEWQTSETITNNINSTETTFIFPSNAVYFSVFLGADPNMTTPINLSDVTATAEWITRLDSDDENINMHLYSDNYNATDPTITWLNGKTLAANGHVANNADFVTSDFIPCADMVNVEINTSTNEVYPNIYICRYTDDNEDSLLGERERLLNTRSAFLGSAKFFRIAIKTTLANAQANITYHLYGTQRYKGKVYALGDSITQGTWNDGVNSGGNYSECYIQTFADLKGYKLVNLGDHNSGLLSKGTNTQQSIKGFIDNNTFTDADMVTIAYGINDYINNRVLGTVNDAVDANTCAGQLKYALSTLMGDGTANSGKAPKAKIVILLPLNGNRIYSSNISTPTFADNWFFGAANLTQNKTLEDYRQVIKEIGEYYGAEVIDFYAISPLNRGNLMSLLGDGLHPSKECHKKLGIALAGCL